MERFHEIIQTLQFFDQLHFGFWLLALLSLTFAVIGNMLSHFLLKDIKSNEIIGINFLIMAGTLVAFSPFFFEYNFQKAALVPLLWVIVLDISANYFYFRLFEKKLSTLSYSFFSLGAGLAFFFGWLFWSGAFSYLTTALSFAALFFCIFLSLGFKNFLSLARDIFFAFLFFFLSSLPSQVILSDMAVINPPTLYMVRAGMIGLLGLLISGNLKKLEMKQYKFIFIRGIFVILQWICMYYALMQFVGS